MCSVKLSCHAQLAAIPDGFARRTRTGLGMTVRMRVVVVSLDCHARRATNRRKVSDRGCRRASRRRLIARRADKLDLRSTGVAAVAPIFVANHRRHLPSRSLLLSGRRVISGVPPCLRNDRLDLAFRRFSGAQCAVVSDVDGRIRARNRNDRNSTDGASQ